MANTGRETPPDLPEGGHFMYGDVQFEIKEGGEAEKLLEATRMLKLLKPGKPNR